MPADDFEQVMNPWKHHQSMYLEPYFFCDEQAGQCFYNTTCDLVKSHYVQDGSIYDINLFLDNGGMTISWEDLYVNGSYVNPDVKEDRCYISIIKSDQLKPGYWEIDAAAMVNHYFVYDFTMRVNHTSHPLTYYKSIGIGRKNPNNTIR